MKSPLYAALAFSLCLAAILLFTLGGLGPSPSHLEKRKIILQLPRSRNRDGTPRSTHSKDSKPLPNSPYLRPPTSRPSTTGPRKSPTKNSRTSSPNPASLATLDSPAGFAAPSTQNGGAATQSHVLNTWLAFRKPRESTS